MLKATDNKGFQLTFANGITISVQFGRGNYCFNRTSEQVQVHGCVSCKNAEVAIWDAEFNNFVHEGKLEIGWQDANEVAKWIEIASKVSSISEIQKEMLK